MTTLTKVFLILGVASITYGFARWQVLTEVLSKQNGHFQKFFAAHSEVATAQVTKQDVGQLYERVMLSGGTHPGWPQAIFPVAFGLMTFAFAFYCGQRQKGGRNDSPNESSMSSRE